MPAPSIGRIIRYVLSSGPNAGAQRAALITQVHDDGLIDVTVFPAPGDQVGPMMAIRDVAEDPRIEPLSGTWQWPADIPVRRASLDLEATQFGIAGP